MNGWERSGLKGELADDAASDQMFVDDSVQDLWRAVAVPDAVRVNHRDRALHADAQAPGFGAVDPPGGARETHRLEPALEVFPGAMSHFGGCAFRLGRIHAQENVPLRGADAEHVGSGGGAGVGGSGRKGVGLGHGGERPQEAWHWVEGDAKSRKPHAAGGRESAQVARLRFFLPQTAFPAFNPGANHHP